jgi:hypothetical protein
MIRGNGELPGFRREWLGARAVAPLLPGEAWTLLSPEPDARVDAARWAHQAETFFRVRLVVLQDKRYPAGTVPLADVVDIELSEAGMAPTRVRVVTVPADRAPEALAAGAAGARAIGGAGFDALIPRTRRVWQIRERVDPPGDPRAPLVVAAVLASLLLAPVVPPEGGTLFGDHAARERLRARGLAT